MTPHDPADRSPDRLQQQARTMLAALHMLVRSVKLYDPQNAVFEKPLQAMADAMSALVAEEGRLDLAVVSGSYYVNSQLVRIDQSSVEHVRFLAEEFATRGIDGLSTNQAPSLDDLRNFALVFSGDHSQRLTQVGLPGHELRAMRLSRGGKLEERLDEIGLETDPRTHALTLYARGLVFMEAQRQAIRDGRLTAPGPAGRLIQGLIDAFGKSEALLLASMRNGAGEAASAHHMLNTALLAIAFGRALALTRPQLRDVGLAALWSELGLCALPLEARLSAAPERLAAEVQMQRLKAAYDAAAATLSGPGAGRQQQLRAVAAVAIHMPFNRLVTDAQGQMSTQPQGDPLYVARIIALCSYLDGLTMQTSEHAALPLTKALAYMWARQSWRFDPELLAAFVRTMVRLPIKPTTD